MGWGMGWIVRSNPPYFAFSLLKNKREKKNERLDIWGGEVLGNEGQQNDTVLAVKRVFTSTPFTLGYGYVTPYCDVV